MEQVADEANGLRMVHTVVEPPPPPQRESLLLRLFESTLFDMSMAITYLFKSKETGVLSYIGNKMFSFEDQDVDFYLFQLVTLYIHHADVAEALHPYLVHRCRQSSSLSLQLVWLLNACCSDSNNGTTKALTPRSKKSLGLKLKSLILSEGLRPKHLTPLQPLNHRPLKLQPQFSQFKKAHFRSYSDATVGAGAQLSVARTTLGDLSSGHAFDNGCVCFSDTNSDFIPANSLPVTTCQCGAPRLSAEYEFVKCLISIGARLQNIPAKDVKSQRLLAELSMLNLNIPARVWLPIYDFPHLIVRVPPGAAVLLNSKDRAPYLVYFEAIEVQGDVSSAPLPQKQINSLRQTKSEENLLKYSQKNGLSSSNSQQFTVCPAVDNDNDCWTYEDDELSKQYANGTRAARERDTISQMSQDSNASDEKNPTTVFVAAGDIRRRLKESLNTPKTTFTRDPDDPSAAALKEPWDEKAERIRRDSPFGHLPGGLRMISKALAVATAAGPLRASAVR